MSAHLSEIYGLMPVHGAAHFILGAIIIWFIIMYIVENFDSRRW